LTEKGQQILRESSKANQDWLENLVQTMTVDEQAQVRNALVTLIDKAHQLDTNSS
jgi:DNA-binding MarR family transcriptional regulator